MEEDMKISEEQAQAIAQDLDDFVKGTDIENIQNLPSNNGVEERIDPPEEGETKVINTTINPLTGETMILDTSSEIEDDGRSFEEKVTDTMESIDDNIFDNDTPASMEEFSKVLQDDNLLKEIGGNDLNLEPEEIRLILDITNRRIHREEFNVYKVLPDSVKAMIDEYVKKELGIELGVASVAHVNAVKNSVASAIIDQFQTDIQFERARHDFAHELANLYRDSSADIAESSIEYFEERNKAYRDAADKIEDPEKKQRMLEILDRIDQARNLNELKEFAKKCKIKKIELEKPSQRVFDQFVLKYKDSTNNIYDIKMCVHILARNLPERTDFEIYSFFIVFCKYVMNWDVSIPINHAFIYYILYYCAMLDGDKSNTFRNNVREVIDNVKVRNSGIDFGKISPEELEARLNEIEEMKKRREEAAKKHEEEEKRKQEYEARQNLAEEVAEEQDDEIEESFEDEVVNE